MTLPSASDAVDGFSTGRAAHALRASWQVPGAQNRRGSAALAAHITKTASLQSRGGDSWRRCGCTFAEPLHDLLDDLARMRTDRNYDRMLTRAAIMFDRDIYTTTRRGPAEPAMISLFATHHLASRITRVRG
jgi:hypothetical protein